MWPNRVGVPSSRPPRSKIGDGPTCRLRYVVLPREHHCYPEAGDTRPGGRHVAKRTSESPSPPDSLSQGIRKGRDPVRIASFVTTNTGGKPLFSSSSRVMGQ